MRSDRNNKHALFQPAALTPAQIAELTAELIAARKEVEKVTADYNNHFVKLQDTLEKIKKYQRKLTKDKSGEEIKSFELEITKLTTDKKLLKPEVKAHERNVAAAWDKVTALSEKLGIQVNRDSPSALYDKIEVKTKINNM